MNEREIHFYLEDGYIYARFIENGKQKVKDWFVPYEVQMGMLIRDWVMNGMLPKGD